MKTCRICNETKPLDEFYRDRRSADGKDSYCKDCRKRRTKDCKNGVESVTRGVFGNLANCENLSPHEKLATAILIQAVRDARNYKRARTWLSSDVCQFYAESVGINHQILINYLMMGCPSQLRMREARNKLFEGV